MLKTGWMAQWFKELAAEREVEGSIPHSALLRVEPASVALGQAAKSPGAATTTTPEEGKRKSTSEVPLPRKPLKGLPQVRMGTWRDMLIVMKTEERLVGNGLP